MDTLDLNPGPSACEADVMPLHHVPSVQLAPATVTEPFQLHWPRLERFWKARSTSAQISLLFSDDIPVAGPVLWER